MFFACTGALSDGAFGLRPEYKVDPVRNLNLAHGSINKGLRAAGLVCCSGPPPT